MITDQVLNLAVDRGLISAAQAEGLRGLARENGAPDLPPPLPTAPRDEIGEPDAERLRFVTGFADIFVTMGLALFFGAAAYLLSLYVVGATLWAIVAALAWILAEFFTRRRRMALPSIVLLALFSIAVFGTAFELMMRPEPRSYADWLPVWQTRFWSIEHARDIVVAAVVSAIFVALHYWRFRVPITVAAGAAALVTAATAALDWLLPYASWTMHNGLMLLCGLFVFALAMRFDMSDPERRTRRTDIAFWLHLLAAPLIVHPLITALLQGYALETKLNTASAIAILGIFFALGIVSVIIDRRALLVSGLIYAGLAFGTLIEQTALADKAIPASILILGLFILLLSAGWRPLRRSLLHLLPAPFTRRLPNPLSP
ncbi:MAG TPA: hypothetical protein VKV77_13725 [Methylovirgula sp.]|nr:hypothetical protein [Methylovirgula sp.]